MIAQLSISPHCACGTDAECTARDEAGALAYGCSACCGHRAAFCTLFGGRPPAPLMELTMSSGAPCAPSRAYRTAEPAKDVATVLGAYGYRFHSEADLQQGLERVLVQHKVPHVREANLSTGDRVDFLLPAAGVGIEVKVGGSWPALVRQLHRYANAAEISSLLVVTSRARLQVDLPSTIAGKPVRALRVGGNRL